MSRPCNRRSRSRAGRPLTSSRRIGRRRLALAVVVVVSAASSAAWAIAALVPAFDGAGAARTAQWSSWPVGRGGPVAFAPGACVAYAPGGRWNGRTVFVDAGHGGADPGATSSSATGPVSEADLSLGITRRMQTLLVAAGYRVVVSRSSDQNVVALRAADVAGKSLKPAGVKRDIEARNACANAAAAEALVAVHANAFGDPSVGGAQTLYNANRPFSSRSRKLAGRLQRSVVASMAAAGWSTVDRGVASDAGAGADALTDEAAAYGQLLQLGPASPPWFRTETRMPGAIVEPLFISSPQELARALEGGGLAVIAGGLARGIELNLPAAAAP